MDVLFYMAKKQTPTTCGHQQAQGNHTQAHGGQLQPVFMPV